MKHASTLADLTMVDSLIVKIKMLDNDLAQNIKQLANNFEFDIILNAIEKMEKE